MRASFRQAFRPTRLYLAAGALFITHQLSQKLLGLPWPFLDSYLDPFLCIPLLLGAALAEQRWLMGRRADEPFNAIEIMAMTMALAVLFEEGFPRLDPLRQTRDNWDYVAYGIGAAAYYFITKTKVRAAAKRLVKPED